MTTPVPALLPDHIKRITYSKYLFSKASSLQRDSNELASAQAVLVAHDATEMLMRVVLDFIGAKPLDKFMQFWKNVPDVSGCTMPPHKAARDSHSLSPFPGPGDTPPPRAATAPH